MLHDFFLVDQNIGILEHHFHPLGISDEIRREIAAIELHALHGDQLRHHGLRFFHRDDAVLAHLLHRLGNNISDGFIAVGRDAAHLSDHVARNRLRQLLDRLHGDFHGFVDAALHGHRVHARSHGLHAFSINDLRQHGGGGGPIAGYVGGFRSHLAHHLRSHVFERILKFNLLGHRHSVFGDGGSAKLFLQHDIAALGAQGDLHGVGQLIHTAQDGLPRMIRINDLFCHLVSSLSWQPPAAYSKSRGFHPRA